MRAPLVALLTILAAGTAHAADVEVSLELRRDGKVMTSPKVALGEPFEVLVKVRAAPGVEVNVPASWPMEPFELTGRNEPAPLPMGGLVEHAFHFTGYAWDVGEQMFPPVPVTYVIDGEVKQTQTDALKVQVASVLGNKAAPPELRPAAPPVKLTRPDWRLFWGLVGAGMGLFMLGLALLVAYLVSKGRSKRLAPTAAFVVVRPADEIALGKLAALRDQLDAEDRRPLYFAMSDVVREYVGKRYGLDALELTTAELLDQLTRLQPYLVGEVAPWVKACDAVKYTGRPATRDQAAAMLEEAIAVVQRLRPAAPVPAPPSPAVPVAAPLPSTPPVARTGNDVG